MHSRPHLAVSFKYRAFSKVRSSVTAVMLYWSVHSAITNICSVSTSKYSLVPRPFLRAREKWPGTYCWHMRLVTQILGNLDTPAYYLFFVAVIPCFTSVFYISVMVSAGEDNLWILYIMVSNALVGPISF